MEDHVDPVNNQYFTGLHTEIENIENTLGIYVHEGFGNVKDKLEQHGHTGGVDGKTIPAVVPCWKLIKSIEIGTNCTQYDVTGLDGDTDGEYMILCRWVGGAYSWGGDFKMRLNGDSGNNYGYQKGTASGGSASAALTQPTNGMAVGYHNDAGQLSFVNLTLHAKSGKERQALGLENYAATGTLPGVLSMVSQIWSNTADNLTWLRFVGPETNSIGAGSVIEIFKRDKTGL